MKRKDSLFLVISCFLLVFAWIIFSIYRQSVTSTISKTLSIQILPITPEFDGQVIDRIKKRKAVPPLYDLRQTQASPTPQLVNQRVSPTATQSGTTPTQKR